MQFDFKFSKNNYANIAKSAARFWQKIHIILFFALLFTAVVLGWYFWHQSLYGQGWSEERKQEFLKSQNKDVVLNEKDLQKVIDDVELRKKQDSNFYQQIKDIFVQYK